MSETPEERKARLVAEIKERARELVEDYDVEAHSLGNETQVFEGSRSADIVCAGYYSDQ
jgi:hypothetical protein